MQETFLKTFDLTLFYAIEILILFLLYRQRRLHRKRATGIGILELALFAMQIGNIFV